MTVPSTPKRPSDLAIRTMAACAMAATALLAMWAGGIAFWLICVVASLFMMAEWSNLHAATPRDKRVAQFALSVPLAIMAPPSLILENRDFFVLGLLAGAAFFAVIVTRRRELAGGILYCGVPVLALTLLRRQEDGLLLIIWAMLLVWACDTGAYFAGRAIGGPKLAPRISPSKTWAGLIGGVLAATAWSAVLHIRFGLPATLVAATPVLALLSQAGDLFESVLKRRAGVKDSGDVLPGHGGVMDRMDGIVPVAPAAALCVLLPRLLG